MEWKFSAPRRKRCGKTLGNAALGRGIVLNPGLNRTSSEHARVADGEAAALLWQLGGVNQVYLLSFSEAELGDREPFDEMHESMAARALP